MIMDLFIPALCVAIGQGLLGALMNHLHTRSIRQITDMQTKRLIDALQMMSDTEQRLYRLEKRLNLGQIVPIKKDIK